MGNQLLRCSKDPQSHDLAHINTPATPFVNIQTPCSDNYDNTSAVAATFPKPHKQGLPTNLRMCTASCHPCTFAPQRLLDTRLNFPTVLHLVLYDRGCKARVVTSKCVMDLWLNRVKPFITMLMTPPQVSRWLSLDS